KRVPCHDVVIQALQMRRLKRFLRTLLGSRGVERIRSLLNRARLNWLRVASRSTVLARLHYLLFSDAFDREIKAVIAGHLEFERNRSGRESVNYFLRRCLYRLEKGLLMRPRPDLFALDFILPAVEAYSASLPVVNPDEIKWARDVLASYFEVVASLPV